MVSVFFDRASTRPSPQHMSARLTLGRQPSEQVVVDAEVRAVGRRGAVLRTADPLAGASHAWLELTLPGGEIIRPLVRVGRENDGHTPVRFRHVWPRDRAALEAFHAARATRAGY